MFILAKCKVRSQNEMP